MRKLSIVQILNIVVTLITITVNGLANSLPFNGQTTGEISDRFAILFVPAGYVFSIWGLIYLGLILFTIYQARPSLRENTLLRQISPAYWLASLANTVWIFLWHYEFFILTLVAMLTLLISLVFIYQQISSRRETFGRSQKWFIQWPFSVYLAWISVATIANVSQVLYFAGWDAFGLDPALWAAIMLGVATVLGFLMLTREQDPAYVLVLIWAFAGIALKQSAEPVVAYTAMGAIALLSIALIIYLLRNNPFSRQSVDSARTVDTLDA